MKKNIVLIIAGLVIFAVGFGAGMEYKAYTIRTALKDVFGGTGSDTNTTAMQEAKKENIQTIEKAVGDEITLATMNLKVTSVNEKQILNPSYGSPKVAKEGTKFVVVGMDITNTTNSAFDFSPSMIILDNKEREFSTYSDSIGAIENYLNYKTLSPSVKESGYLVYEIPTDATNYSLMVAKAGTKELYKIVLK